MPRASSASLAVLVFGVSMPQLSTTMILPSFARSDRADLSASFTIFFGVFWSYLRGFGPRATPPPLKCGPRIEPWRALPVPFWAYGLRPPPRTSARVLVLCVPERRAASWAVTTWCMTGTFGWTANMSSSSFDGAGILAGHVLERERCHVQLAFPCSGPAIFTALRTMTTPPAGPGTEPLINSRLRSASDCDDLEVLRGDLLVTHVAGHALALEDASRGTSTSRWRRACGGSCCYRARRAGP